MDPVSAAASVAGLTSLAIQVVELVAKYSLEAKGAKDDIDNLHVRLGSLQSVLTRLEQFLRCNVDENVNFHADAGLRIAMRHCEDQLRRCKEKFFEKDPKMEETIPSDRNRLIAPKEKAIAITRQLLWPFRKGEVQETCQSLFQCIQAFQFFVDIRNSELLATNCANLRAYVGRQESSINDILKLNDSLSDNLGDTLKQLKDMMSVVESDTGGVTNSLENLHDKIDRQHLQEVINWVSPDLFEKKHDEISSKQSPGSCKKMLACKQIEDWVSDTNIDQRHLSCLGDPGAGKSVFCSAVVNELRHRYRSFDRHVICYVYFDHQRQKMQSVSDVSRSLLRQALGFSKWIPPMLEQDFQNHRKPTTEETLVHLHNVIERFKAFYICIDGLDECSPQLFGDTLDMIRQLAEAKILITARKHIQTDIQRVLPQSALVLVTADENDVNAFLRTRIAKSKAEDPKIMNDDLESTLIERVMSLSKGLFLLPALHVENVLGHSTITRRRRALEDLSGSIDEALKGTFERIHDQGQNKAQLALEAIAWVLLAFHPLTLTELRHAVSIEVGTSQFGGDDIVSDHIIRYCLGVLVEGPNSTVQFMHFTLGEFLESSHHLVLGIGHETIAQKCITHVMHKSLACEGDHDIFILQRGIGLYKAQRFPVDHSPRFPLLKYAALFWGDHTRHVQDESKKTEELALHFVLSIMDELQSGYECNASYYMWRHALLLELAKGNGSNWKLPIFDLLSHFGLYSLWKQVRERFPELRPTEVGHNWRHGALLFARHKAMVEFISMELPQDLQRFGGDLLISSYKNGRHDIVRWLLQKPNINVNCASSTGASLIDVCKEKDIRRALKQHPRFRPYISPDQPTR